QRALDAGNKDLELLETLAAYQRRAPARRLVVTLLRISDAKGGDVDALREAVEVALDPVADRALAKTIAEKLLDAAEAVWTSGQSPASRSFGSPAEAAAWALEALARLVHEEAPARPSDLFPP